MNKILTGHTTPDTAIVINDYPYGFRLRTSIRYWLETKGKSGCGQRFCHQTLNPKTGRWNAPKTSTYFVVGALIQDSDTGYISYEYLQSGGWDKEEKIADFESRLKEAGGLGDYERRAIKYIRATIAANARLHWEIASGEPNQTLKEQGQIINSVISQEYRRLTVQELKEG